MRIPGIDPPALSLLTRRQTGVQWLRQHQRGSVFHVSDGSIFGGNGTAMFDTVILSYVLNYCEGLEGKRKALETAKRIAYRGGQVLAVARACDSGIELAERMITMGVAPDELGISNLSNKEIAVLKPNEAVFLSSIQTVGLTLEEESRDEDFDSLMAFATSVRKSPVRPDIRGFNFPEKFTTKILDVGLKWQL